MTSSQVQTTDEVVRAFEQIPVPDHANDNAWVVRGETTDLTGPAVFLVHPTTASQGWFGDPGDPEVAGAVVECVRSQVDAFPGVVWAPHYRQASTRAFHERERGGEQAYDLAYDDVARAFSQFLVDDARLSGPARPLVLVGHSQGARHVRSLVEEFFDHPTLAARLVAAYVIGVPVDAADPLLARFPLASDPDQTGVSVLYQARLEPAGGVPAAPAAGPGDPACVTGDALGVLGTRADHGGADALTRAGGFLVVPRARAGDHGRRALPDGRLHHVEVEVMADLLARDVRRRTRAWRSSRAAGPVGDAAAVVERRSGFPVEHWPGAEGTSLRLPSGLVHVVDLPGPVAAAPGQGDLVPLVLLHKLGGWAAEWRGVARLASRTRRVVVVDLPGHGASVQDVDVPWVQWPEESARAVLTVLGELGIGRAHLMGCSLGGVVATHLALAAPERVGSLALVGASVTPRLSVSRTWEIDRAVRPGFGPGWMPRPGQNGRAATEDPAVLAEQDASRARAGGWVRPSERGVGLSGVEEHLAVVAVPVLYLNGERAGYRSYEARVRELLPDAEVAVVADAGAFVHQERADEVARVWERWVAQGERSPGSGGTASSI